MKTRQSITAMNCFCLGFTFSFPCKQEGLASARLTTWTKGFTCAGVVNEDVVKLLQTAIDEKVIQIEGNIYSFQSNISFV